MKQDDWFNSLWDDIGRPSWMRGFSEPKDEPSLPFNKRVLSRIACNKFILERLRKTS